MDLIEKKRYRHVRLKNKRTKNNEDNSVVIKILFIQNLLGLIRGGKGVFFCYYNSSMNSLTASTDCPQAFSYIPKK